MLHAQSFRTSIYWRDLVDFALTTIRLKAENDPGAQDEGVSFEHIAQRLQEARAAALPRAADAGDVDLLPLVREAIFKHLRSPEPFVAVSAAGLITLTLHGAHREATYRRIDGLVPAVVTVYAERREKNDKGLTELLTLAVLRSVGGLLDTESFLDDFERRGGWRPVKFQAIEVLDLLEDRGLVRSEAVLGVVRRGRAPKVKEYAITPAGMAELDAVTAALVGGGESDTMVGSSVPVPFVPRAVRSKVEVLSAGRERWLHSVTGAEGGARAGVGSVDESGSGVQRVVISERLAGVIRDAVSFLALHFGSRLPMLVRCGQTERVASIVLEEGLLPRAFLDQYDDVFFKNLSDVVLQVGERLCEDEFVLTTISESLAVNAILARAEYRLRQAVDGPFLEDIAVLVGLRRALLAQQLHEGLFRLESASDSTMHYDVASEAHDIAHWFSPKERTEFDLPFEYDLADIASAYPEVAFVHDLSVADVGFGAYLDQTIMKDPKWRSFGSSVITDLRSGKFDRDVVSVLAGTEGPQLDELQAAAVGILRHRIAVGGVFVTEVVLDDLTVLDGDRFDVLTQVLRAELGSANDADFDVSVKNTFIDDVGPATLITVHQLTMGRESPTGAFESYGDEFPKVDRAVFLLLRQPATPTRTLYVLDRALGATLIGDHGRLVFLWPSAWDRAAVNAEASGLFVQQVVESAEAIAH